MLLPLLMQVGMFGDGPGPVDPVDPWCVQATQVLTSRIAEFQPTTSRIAAQQTGCDHD